VSLNQEKADILCRKLWERPHLAKMQKLEIGCGTGYHAASLARIYPQYYDTYTGIDLSETAVEKARSWGLKAEVANIFDYNPGRKFDAFLLLDTLEHIEDRDRVAEKIKELANRNYVLFANVPLYLIDRGFEYPINFHDVFNFVKKCGFHHFDHEIYGCYGFPYMFFEAVHATSVDPIPSS
jgi:SAM-dependent methyltransferase